MRRAWDFHPNVRLHAVYPESIRPNPTRCVLACDGSTAWCSSWQLRYRTEQKKKTKAPDPPMPKAQQQQQPGIQEGPYEADMNGRGTGDGVRFRYFFPLRLHITPTHPPALSASPQ